MDAQGDTPLAAVAVAASAGGVEALTGFVAGLPPTFPAAVCVVLHVSDTGPSLLPRILTRAGKLRAVHARHGDRLRPGRVLVAPPGQHLLVHDAQVRLDRGPSQNGHRPSADVLFRSVAERFGRRSAGIVLSGTMDDGAAGLHAIARAGGLTIVQDPNESAFPGMPMAALAETSAEVVCPVADMGKHLTEWLEHMAEERGAVPSEPAPPPQGDSIEVTAFTCPECGGSLWLAPDGGLDRFRCRVGHAFSPQGLLLGKHAALEAALWAAIVALEERVDISRRTLTRVREAGYRNQVTRYEDDIARIEERIAVLKDILDGVISDQPAIEERGDGFQTTP